ncbi:polo kinase [Monosiga brevicollis MX1]|uniref:Serine/threonine-protein kinase PLK n=1 Tax=Monosiga brevicollis TaxID=81824 RepID=A9VDW2_MONBE|nr:polo kinase [Monosiga brevicollis MX1]EDQ84288.1 polo kinase [Monosiga brevicollis MX1]|eukprot:XP_001750918.1 polo kinase [Monosiga brevicollis MX1]
MATAMPARSAAYGRRPVTTGSRASSSSSRFSSSSIPSIIEDSATGAKYIRGSFLGKGGFAQCYKLTDSMTKRVYAGKIVAKSSLSKHRAKEKLKSEIQIHRSLTHKYIVGFHSYFEDEHNVYILLEICSNQSMMELHKRRRGMSEIEARWFLLQIVEATAHMHARRVIHRDLKLGNLFLNEEMQVKVGDFGLATALTHDGERKRTLCGTPNYIAPEILEGKDSGHSFEVDIWSIGCILYTMIVGRPPFETRDIKTTYSKIKRNDYSFPSTLQISPEAVDLIRMLLHRDPKCRPNCEEIMRHPFLAGSAYIPQRMPIKALHMTPDFAGIPGQVRPAATYRAQPGSAHTNLENPVTTTSVGAKIHAESLVPSGRAPLGSLNTNREDARHISKPAPKVIDMRSTDPHPKTVAPTQTHRVASVAATSTTTPSTTPRAANDNLQALYTRLSQVTALQAAASYREPMEAPAPEAKAGYAVTKWIDYSYKYGLGYQLSDDSVGVLFNDNTKMVLSSDLHHVEFTNRERKGGATTAMTLDSFPDDMTKKIALLKYFRDYMRDNLQDGPAALAKASAQTTDMPFVKKWLRTKHAIVFRLNIGIVQINFFDHTKVVVNGPRDTVAFIDTEGETRVYTLDEISRSKHASIDVLVARLSYATDVINHMLSKSRQSSPQRA